MPRFFMKQMDIDDSYLMITGDDARHIARALRMAVGDLITVCDTNRNEYDCEILEFDEDISVKVRVISAKPSVNEPLCYVKLFQALPKGDKLDTVIQKAVECGVSEIYPFESERCVVRVKPEAEARKTERRRKVSEEAAKQCGRSIIPEVSETLSFDDMLERASESDVCLFCYEGEGTSSLGTILKEKLKDEGRGYPTVSVIVGSEGGFSRSEADRAKAVGMIKTGLGRRILRTETAPIFVLSSIVTHTEL